MSSLHSLPSYSAVYSCLPPSKTISSPQIPCRHTSRLPYSEPYYFLVFPVNESTTCSSSVCTSSTSLTSDFIHKKELYEITPLRGKNRGRHFETGLHESLLLSSPLFSSQPTFGPVVLNAEVRASDVFAFIVTSRDGRLAVRLLFMHLRLCISLRRCSSFSFSIDFVYNLHLTKKDGQPEKGKVDKSYVLSRQSDSKRQSI